jgi:hypothetical protein
MTDRLPRNPMIYGDCRFESMLFSNRWRLIQGKQVLAELQRVPTRHTSLLRFPDRTLVEIRPSGWGTVVAYRGADELGRVTRLSWWGRTWQLTGPGFACSLTSDLRPRRWSLRLGAEPVAQLSGGLLSYNRLAVHTDVAVPTVSIALAWHVLARPWEAAASPGALLPAHQPTYRVAGQRG